MADCKLLRECNKTISPDDVDLEFDSLLLHDKIYVVPQSSRNNYLNSAKNKKSVLLVQVKIISYEYKN